MSSQKNPAFEDDAKEKISLLIEHRLPWLIIGLVGGIVATILSSYFEKVISSNISLVFFIPIIVYMADAVGHQTESVYIRNIAREKVRLSTYLFKEFILGLVLGIFFGLVTSLFAFLWFHSINTSLAVGFAMFASMAIAPIVALVIPAIIQKEHQDPAVGAGPFATVIQDIISLFIYFTISSVIILGI